MGLSILGDNFLQSSLIKREEASRVFGTIEEGATSLDKDVQRKEWTPDKLNAIQAVRNIQNLGEPEQTSTPLRSSETEHNRLILEADVQAIEDLTTGIRSLQLNEESCDEDEQIMLEDTTDIARTMPCLLEGTYEQRLATVNQL